MKIRTKLNTDEILILLGLIAFFRPTIFEKYTISNFIFNTLLVADFIAVGVLLFLRNEVRWDAFSIFAIAYYSLMVISTIVKHGSYARMIQFVAVGVFSVFFVRFMILHGLVFATHVMRIMAWIYVLVNIITIILWPDGITVTGNQSMAVFFLGQTTRFAYYYIPALLFCYIGDLFERGKPGGNTIALYFVCLATLIASWTVGSAIAFLLMIPFFLFGNHKIFNPIIYFAIQIAGYIGVTFYSIQNNYAEIITSFLHKDTTLSSRTLIWNSALSLISKNTMLGIGIQTNEYMLRYFGFVHVHNHLLQVMLQCGILGLIIFLLMIFISYSALNKNNQSKFSKIIAFIIFIIGIQLLVDTVDGVRNHYLFILAIGAAVSEVIKVYEHYRSQVRAE